MLTEPEKIARLRDALSSAEKVFADLERGRIPPVSYRQVLRVVRSALEATDPIDGLPQISKADGLRMRSGHPKPTSES